MNLISVSKKITSSIILIFAITQYTLAQNSPEAGKIIDAMQSKYKNIPSFSAVFSYTSSGNQAFQGDITVKGQKFRLKMAGQEIYNNGKEVATYIKETNEVNINDYEASEDDLSPAKIYTFDKKSYKYVFIKELKEKNETFQIIELSPLKKGTKVTKVQIKVNKIDKTVKSWIITDKNKKTDSFVVSKFNANAKVDDKFFSFDKTKYPKVEINDLR
ncbi:MAG: outer membrane lipoprotein carrier protein LolA [Pseudarcicella sp.]|nr:outer membrane lipoprotein carrier protein LolA [Pseudarcicella sp.]